MSFVDGCGGDKAIHLTQTFLVITINLAEWRSFQCCAIRSNTASRGCLLPCRMVSPAAWFLLLGVVSCTSTLEPRTKVEHNATQEPFLDQCTLVPTWTIGGETAVNLVGQNITVVALLNSSRVFGRRQAARLSSLRNRLYQAGFPDINFYVINSIMATDNTDLLQNEAVDIPVYQELPEAPVRDILGADNDHILVLDRCGRMAYQVITPFSKLIYPYVKAAILSTYKDNPCGFCNSTTSVDYSQDEDENTTLRYASDEPAHDYTELNSTISENDSKRFALKTGYIEGNQSLHTDLHQAESTIKNQLSLQNLTAAEPRELLYVPKDESRVDIQFRAVSRNPRNDIYNLSSPKAYDQHPSIISLARIPGEQEPSKNWNWFEPQNSASGEPYSTENSNSESVEVVHQVKPPKTGKKRRKKAKTKDLKTDNLVREPLFNQNVDCKKLEKSSNALVPQTFCDSNSQEVIHDSMEALVNQTQRLFDWYQRQIENGTSSEEEYEKSNVLKEKIIEHYSRLLPWLNFKLN